MYRLGVDIGSTTAKAVLVNDKKEIVYSNYLRHNADVKGTLLNILESIKKAFDENGIVIPYNQLDVHVKKD